MARDVQMVELTPRAKDLADLIMNFARVHIHAEFAPYVFTDQDVETLVSMAVGDRYIELLYPMPEEEALTEQGWKHMVEAGVVTLT